MVAKSSFARPGAYVGQLFLFLYDHIDKLMASLQKIYYPVHKKVTYHRIFSSESESILPHAATVSGWGRRRIGQLRLPRGLRRVHPS